MRILINDQPGHAFCVQLSRSLAKRGHKVLHVYANFFQSPKGPLKKRVDDPSDFDIQSIHLSQPFDKYSFIKRRGQDIEYGHLLTKEMELFKPDVFISSCTPVDAQSVILKKCLKADIKFVFWVQDLYGIGISKVLTKKIPLLGHLIGWYYTRLEQSLIKQSDAVVLITEDFVPIMDSFGVIRDKTHVIENWATLEEMPVKPKNNAWAREHNLENRFCFMYSGTLGLKHNPDLLLQLAIRFKHYENVRVVVISEGLGAAWLKEKKQSFGVENLVLLRFQPFEQMPEVLAGADVFVAILEPTAGIFSVPSKVLTYHCAGRPLLLAVPSENLAAHIVQKNKTGVVVSPSDTKTFLDAAASLIDDVKLREELGKKARKYAETHFDIDSISDRFEGIISGL